MSSTPGWPSSEASLLARWQAAARLVAGSRDVLAARPLPGEPPPALVARGWSDFLLALDGDQLEAHETLGLDAVWPAYAPPSLLALHEDARAVCALPPVAAGGDGPARIPRQLETPRKSAQIDAFARVVLPLAARATRVLDVGSGHGHLTRDIAERLALPVIGLERDGALAGRARSLPSPRAPSFTVTDVLRDGLPLVAGDLVMGLHACGELGDAIVTRAAAAGASVALVGCCLQKRRAQARAALCAETDTTLDLPTALLGLSNLSARDQGVEATRAENLRARQRRLALHRLLSLQAGAPLRPGTELVGLNRRAAHDELPELAARAFALRSWPPPTAAAIDDARTWAAAEHDRVRRLALPRALLARVLEVFVLLDRARYLETHGFMVEIGTLFPAEISARNLVLLATR